MSRIRVQDIRVIREELLEQQSGFCAICGEELKPEEAVLDHCHQSGHIRGTIHNKCNTLLGKIENFNRRYKHHNLASFLDGVMEYITRPSYNYIHPSHKTLEEKKALQAKRRKRKAKNGKLLGKHARRTTSSE